MLQTNAVAISSKQDAVSNFQEKPNDTAPSTQLIQFLSTYTHMYIVQHQIHLKGTWHVKHSLKL